VYGLDVNDAADAQADKDNDGFSNIAEYLGVLNSVKMNKKSDMADPLSHPPLVYQLSVVKAGQNLIPLVVEKVEAYGKDKKAWSILVKFEHPKGVRSEYFAIGETIVLNDGIYLVENIVPTVVEMFDETVNRNVKIDRSKVVLGSVNKSQKLEVIVKQKVYGDKQVATLASDITGKVYKVGIADKITIGSDTVGFEVYTVVRINAELGHVELLSDKDGKAFTVSNLPQTATSE